MICILTKSFLAARRGQHCSAAALVAEPAARFAPYQVELDALLKQHGYAPMRWDTASKGGKACPTAYRHWPKSVERWGRGSSSREEEEVEESAAADGGDDGGG